MSSPAPARFSGLRRSHRPEEGRDRLCGFARELVLVMQHIFERPEAQFVDMALAWKSVSIFTGGRRVGRIVAVENPRTVFSGKGKRLWKFADDYSRDVVFILAISRPRMRVEKAIPARKELE